MKNKDWFVITVAWVCMFIILLLIAVAGILAHGL